MSDPNVTRIEIGFPTIAKFFFALFFLYVVHLLGPLLILIFMAILLAVTLNPIVVWLERRLPRSLAILTVGLLVVLGLGIFVGLIFPPLIDQVFELIQKFPEFSKKLLAELPGQSPLHKLGERLLKTPDNFDPTTIFSHILTFSQLALGGMTSVILVLVLCLYLIVDGKRTTDWIIAFFPRSKRDRVKITLEEVAQVIFAYVAGQVLTSLACGIFAFILLSALQVPNAMMLAVLAAVMDILPVLGFIMSLIPAILFALSVSTSTALIVLTAYVAYHAFENYFLVPLVYGKRLRLSSLAVLVSLLVGGLLYGIMGAIAILPIIASYPIIEKYWLEDYLGRTVVDDHKKADQITAPR